MYPTIKGEEDGTKHHCASRPSTAVFVFDVEAVSIEYLLVSTCDCIGDKMVPASSSLFVYISLLTRIA